MAALSHPNICAVFDVGREETPHGTVEYLVVEYLEGLDLSVRLQSGPLPADQLVKAGAESSHMPSDSVSEGSSTQRKGAVLQLCESGSQRALSMPEERLAAARIPVRHNA